ncbi:hypothetical protein M6B38_321440 [Iris pallida]|uniref:Uncharacterized protein n=1 Tax=Iris pallida TaxID=29817 RepID=A0AAX6HCN0_IRIPA|nr:hypothetical protein M6B38_321440 [Iris pallida]
MHNTFKIQLPSTLPFSISYFFFTFKSPTTTNFSLTEPFSTQSIKPEHSNTKVQIPLSSHFILLFSQSLQPNPNSKLYSSLPSSLANPNSRKKNYEEQEGGFEKIKSETHRPVGDVDPRLQAATGVS